MLGLQRKNESMAGKIQKAGAMKSLLISLSIIILILALPQMAEAPFLSTGGPFHWGRYWSVVRIHTTNLGCEATMVKAWWGR